MENAFFFETLPILQRFGVFVLGCVEYDFCESSVQIPENVANSDHVFFSIPLKFVFEKNDVHENLRGFRTDLRNMFRNRHFFVLIFWNHRLTKLISFCVKPVRQSGSFLDRCDMVRNSRDRVPEIFVGSKFHVGGKWTYRSFSFHLLGCA